MNKIDIDKVQEALDNIDGKTNGLINVGADIKIIQDFLNAFTTLDS